MWTLIATIVITAVTVVLTYLLVGPYRRPNESLAPPPDDHGHGAH